MKWGMKLLAIMMVALFFSAGCTDLLSTTVRFQNNSGITVCPVWDGTRIGNIAPGQVTDYREVNPGTHTIMWIDATGARNLTTIAWPNLVDGNAYTFPYN